MSILTLSLIKALVGLGLLNVWLLRFNRATEYRGGDAVTMLEEFRVYGLSPWVCYAVGFCKLSIAFALIASIWFPWLAFPAATALVFLMAAAVLFHFRVGDPLIRSLPAFSLLVLSVCISAYSYSRFLGFI